METLGFNLWCKPYGAICRAPSTSGTFGVRPVSTAEITNMLNGFLGHKEGSLMRTTSHSLKDTLLAWCARYGIDETSRTLLGHHSLQNNKVAWRCNTEQWWWAEAEPSKAGPLYRKLGYSVEAIRAFGLDPEPSLEAPFLGCGCRLISL